MLLDDRPEAINWPDGSKIQVNQKVRTIPTVKPSRFANQTGKVATINIATREGDKWVYVGEVGVNLNGSTVWFRPWELERVQRRS